MLTYEIHAHSFLGDFDAPRARVAIWRGDRCLADVLHENITDALAQARAEVRRLRKRGELPLECGCHPHHYNHAEDRCDYCHEYAEWRRYLDEKDEDRRPRGYWDNEDAWGDE